MSFIRFRSLHLFRFPALRNINFGLFFPIRLLSVHFSSNDSVDMVVFSYLLHFWMSSNSSVRNFIPTNRESSESFHMSMFHSRTVLQERANVLCGPLLVLHIRIYIYLFYWCDLYNNRMWYHSQHMKKRKNLFQEVNLVNYFCSNRLFSRVSHSDILPSYSVTTLTK